ncbi:MAG: magnesium transporter CorA family protein [Deltaproteobacteria bacterium]|nr:magnesium transporter CorA family protein [Deltaproteobacteria bacterium]
MADTRYSIVSPKGKLTPAASQQEALAAMQGSDYVWFDLFNPTHEQLDALAEPLHLHPLTIEDCFDDDQIPKIDLLPEYTFVLFNTFHWEGGELIVEEVDVLVGTKFLLTVHRSASEQRLLGDRFDAAIQLDMGNVRKGPDLLLHLVLDFVVDSKLSAIEKLQDGVDAAEEAILRDPASYKPEGLMHLRRQVLSMRKSLLHEREVLSRICRKDSPFVTDKAIFSFRDIHDHVFRYLEIAEICREMISSDMEMYLSIINNRMTMVANRTNRVMRRLTLITTVFMPLTLLAGVGGMSEWSMMTGSENWRVSYPLFLLLMVVIGVVNYYVLRWLDRRDERVTGASSGELRGDFEGPRSVRAKP